MVTVKRSSPFGGQTRTRALIALALLNESFPREMSRLLSEPINGVLQALAGLEKDGLVAARSAGRTRLYQLDPRYFALAELRAYLTRLAEPETELRNRIDSLRKRPRRAGKRL
jgi:DNA-binding transcriptional ArsR family regulator